MDDKEIVALYLSRDESAIRETQEKYGMRLQRIANGILNDPFAAEECENDTYLEAWNRIPPADPGDYLFGFLGRIVRCKAIDVCRRRESLKREAELCELTQEMSECLPGIRSVEEELEARELSDLIAGFLKSCPDEKRRLFLRRYWFFDSVPELSRSFGCSRGRIKSILFRMRGALKVYLERNGYRI